MYRIAFLLLGSIWILACSEKQVEQIALPYYNEADFTPIFIKNETEMRAKIKHQISDFSFLNQDSILVTQNTVKGKIHLANFIFTSCGLICPTMTQNLKKVSDSLQNDTEVSILSYTVTPWIDSPGVLKRFKEKYKIQNPNWHFLTGNKSEIYTLARKAYFAEEDLGFSKDSTEFLHTEHIVLVDKTNRIRGIYNGTLRLEMQQILDDINTLKKEN